MTKNRLLFFIIAIFPFGAAVAEVKFSKPIESIIAEVNQSKSPSEIYINVGKGASESEILFFLEKNGYSNISMGIISYNDDGEEGKPGEIFFAKDFLGVVWCNIKYNFNDDHHVYVVSVNGVFGDSRYSKEMLKAGVPANDSLVNYRDLNSDILSVLGNECKNNIVNGKMVINIRK